MSGSPPVVITEDDSQNTSVDNTHVIGSVPISSVFSTQQFENNPTYTICIRQDQLLLSWLLSSLIKPILVRLINCVTFDQFWASLAHMDASQRQARSSLLKMQLQTTPKGMVFMNDYIQKMRTILDNLQVTSSVVGNFELVSHILFCLPDEYDSICTPVYARGISIEHVDFGASNHVTSDLQNLTMHNNYSGNDHITVGNDQSLDIDHIGKSHLPISNSKSLGLRNVLHVPQIKKNHISVSQFTFDNNVYLEFHYFYYFVKDHQSLILLKGSIEQCLYKLETSSSSSNSSQSSSSINKATSFAMVGERTFAAVWHNRLGHPASTIVDSVLASNNVLIVGSRSMFVYSYCQ
ncbi:hypothetical protein LIER_31804 [Lithospermum erythrorhizon]|uniref:Retrovirus-related Pol polyprotein from transposon TNT 1-94-like beta-barrel domain-containing protein n=1 Tax=Lithospermum erythrorhizon TaxID=34254 RepID=A0AAV3RXC8_LITER